MAKENIIAEFIKTDVAQITPFTENNSYCTL